MAFERFFRKNLKSAYKRVQLGIFGQKNAPGKPHPAWPPSFKWRLNFQNLKNRGKPRKSLILRSEAKKRAK
jgi:hypothetical protein